MRVSHLFLVGCLLLWASLARAQGEAVLLVEERTYQQYQTFLAGRPPLSVKTFGGQGASRTSIELVLLQQALALGGDTDRVRFEFMPNHLRLMRELQTGKYVAAANTVWQDSIGEAPDAFWLSTAVIRNGQFEAGLYTTKARVGSYRIRSGADLLRLSAVSSHGWSSDWRTLSGLPLQQLFDTASWPNMLNMVIADRADFLLAPFQATDDMSFEANGVVFMPIAGVKLGLLGSRHFVVSRLHADGQRFYQALEKGLAIMLARGAFDRAYREAGFYNDKVRDWLKFSPLERVP